MNEQIIETIGMRLANRAYLYRIFHIVFGADPSSEELHTLGAQETVDAFLYLSKEEQATTVFFEVESQDGFEQVAAAVTLSSAVELLASLGEKADDEDYIDALKSDFTRLFYIPGKSYVYPWESPYIGKEMMLFQESTLDVRHRYREHGFEAQEFGHFPEDHVSMMLDFLAHLGSRAFDAFSDGNDEEFARILSSQGEFISVHLTDWLLKFHKDLCLKDTRGVFCQFAAALRAFLAVDRLFIEKALAAEWISD